MLLNYEVYDNGFKSWVVFVHGIGGSVLTWKKQVEPFSQKYNLLLIDLPGHGKSIGMKKDDITVKSVNRNIKEVLDTLGIEKADFVCMSLGTLVVAHFAIKYPQYVNSIVFGGSIIKIEGIYKWLMNVVAKIKSLFPHRLLYNVFAYIIMPKKKHEKSRKIFIRESLKMKREAFLSWVDYMSEITHPQKTIDRLGNLHIDIFLVSGDEDVVFVNGAKEIAHTLNESKIKIIKDCGHVCTIEKYQDFNNAALDFLTTVHSAGKMAQVA